MSSVLTAKPLRSCGALCKYYFNSRYYVKDIRILQERNNLPVDGCFCSSEPWITNSTVTNELPEQQRDLLVSMVMSTFN